MQFDLNFERDEVYECGAVLSAVLACPGADDEKSSELYRSLCGMALWLWHLKNADDWTPILVKPQYVFRDRKVIDRDVAYVAKRLEKRLIAGRMAIAFFKKAIGLQTLPKGIQGVSVNQMAEFVLDEAEQVDVSNVKRRFWAPSRPVIHLAAAAVIAGQKQSKGGELVGLERFLINRAFVEEVVRMGEELEAACRQRPKIPGQAGSADSISFGLTGVIFSFGL
jgi:hypothetical protein